MHKLMSFIALAILAQWVQPLAAHGPVRHKVTESVDIQAKPESVWRLLEDFGHPAWMPNVASASAQGGNAPGTVRELALIAGGVVKEELKTYAPENMSFSYKHSESPDCAVFPVHNYSASISVEPSGTGAKVTWNGAFYRCFMQNDPPPEQNDEVAIQAVTRLYQAGLAHLKTLAEAQGASIQASPAAAASGPQQAVEPRKFDGAPAPSVAHSPNPIHLPAGEESFDWEGKAASLALALLVLFWAVKSSMRN
jgi:hypothetical protein